MHWHQWIIIYMYLLISCDLFLVDDMLHHISIRYYGLRSIIFNKLSPDTEKYKWLKFSWNDWGVKIKLHQWFSKWWDFCGMDLIWLDFEPKEYPATLCVSDTAWCVTVCITTTVPGTVSSIMIAMMTTVPGTVCQITTHNDVIKWKHFPRYWPFVRGIHRSPVRWISLTKASDAEIWCDIPALVEVAVWRRPGDRPVSEPVMARLLTHICVIRPQWVNDMNFMKYYNTDRNRMMASLHQMMYSCHVLFHFTLSWIRGLLYTGYITILRFIHFTYVIETMLYVILGWMCVSYYFSNTHCDRMFCGHLLVLACMTHRSV